MQLELEILRCSIACAPLLSRLGKETFLATYGEDYTPEDVARYCARAFDPASIATDIERGESHYWTAWRSGKLCGYIKTGRGVIPYTSSSRRQAMEKQMDIHRLYIRPGFQGCGIGRRLLTTVIQKASGLGCERLYLGVRPDNHTARSLYHSMGFEAVGTYPFMVGQHCEMDEVMCKNLLKNDEKNAMLDVDQVCHCG